MMMHSQDRQSPPDGAESGGEVVILVIDSDGGVRSATVRMLQEAGFHVLAGGTAAEAVKLTHRRRPALVLLDVALPDGNGVDVAKELKRDPALAGTFVILVFRTPTNPREQAEGMTESRADGYMARPGSKLELLARLEPFLRFRAGQEALRESEERFRRMFQHSASGMVLVSPELCFLEVNPGFCKMLGYAESELVGKCFQDVTISEDRPAGAELTGRVLSGEMEVFHFEKRYLRKDGTIVWGLASSTLIRDTKRKPLYFVTQIVDITERKRAEEALRESEERHRTILQTAMDGFVRVDLQGRLLEVNEAYCRMSGYSAEELLAMRLPDLEASETPSDTAARIQRIMAQGETRFESRHRRKDGSTIDVEVSAQYQPARGGSFVVFLRDITEQKRAENAVRQERDRAQGYLDTVETIIVALDMEGRITAINRKGCRLLGRREDELVGQVWFSTCLPQPEGMSSVFPAFLKIIAGELAGLEYAENPVVTRSGERRQIAWHNAILRDERGRITGTLSSGEDITERRRAEELLAQAYGRTAAILESISDAFFAIDNDLVVTYFNRAAETALKRKAEDVVGRKLFDAFPEARGSIFEERYRRALQEKIQLSFETYFGVPPYSDWYDVRVYPNSEGISVYFRVITERKRAEEERERLQEQLAQAQKMESIGRLAGGVAHDFNNLLTVINGYASFLSQQLSASDPLRDYALEIGEAGQRAASLTSQLLTFSRKQVIRPRAINLNAVVAEAERMLRHMIGEDIQLDTRLAPKLELVAADPDQIHQVIMNLAVNARDAMPDGGNLGIATADVELDEAAAATHPGAAPGRYVQLTVTDTGMGMVDEVRRNIFEPFFTTKERGRGTGLGLATVYGIVRQSDGWIEVKSEPGRGSTFRIHLPRIDAGLASDEAKPAAANAPHGGETVLVVEDQEGVRRLVKAILEAHGYQVLEAANGVEAYSAARRHPGGIHLLLTDVVMPGISGGALSDQLRELRPNLRVIFMSGYSEEVFAKRGVLAAGTVYIQKPFDPDKLAAKVREILDSPLSF